MNRDQAHRIPPVKGSPMANGYQYDRLDPGYDQPGPPRRSDFSSDTER